MTGCTSGIGLLGMLAFWGILVVTVVVLVRWLEGRSGQPMRAGLNPSACDREPALSILRQRYGAGELTWEQYERMCRVLKQYDDGGERRRYWMLAYNRVASFLTRAFCKECQP